MLTHGRRAGTTQIVTIVLRDMQKKTPYTYIIISTISVVLCAVSCTMNLCANANYVHREIPVIWQSATCLHRSTQTHRPDKQTTHNIIIQQPHGVPRSCELYTSTASCLCCATTFSQYFADSRCCRFDGTATAATASILVAGWLSLSTSRMRAVWLLLLCIAVRIL